MACPLANERIWTDKNQYNTAERQYYESLSKLLTKGNGDQSLGGDASTIVASDPTTDSVTSKKNKKNKNQKNKQLNKQNTNESESNSIISETTSKTCPVIENVSSVAAGTTSNKKNKKDKKKGKSVSSNEKATSVEQDLSSDNKTESVDTTCKTKEIKEKKNKADKKKATSSVDVNNTKGAGSAGSCTLISEIAKARQHIKDSLERMDGIAALASTPGAELLDRLATVEKENCTLRDTVKKLENLVIGLTSRVSKLEGGPKPAAALVKPASVPAKKEEEDDDVDLFGSDEEDDAEAERIREERVKAYSEKKSKKPALIAKSSIILEVKPWDDETDMKELEKNVRKIGMEGLIWGAAKFVPVGYGINKLQICCVIEDDKVSVDELQEKIQEDEDHVQSVDIAAFNKI